MNYTLGSLFDGSGGFPFAGSLCGIEPKWAAEVEPYPIAVTRTRFPKMKHLGDISKVSGAEIEPVDIITFGSPCQDLSVAGKRAGLKHEANGDEETTRSGLFMEAVRIIKEMRKATNGQYPTFALWENVPGAFSSNKGEDFRIVLEELIKIVEPSASMPPIPSGGWAYADSYVGDGWSLAYRVFDAQYWGVPQRRRRIHLVLDLRGERAGEVLFEREGLRGHFETGRTPWQATPEDAQGCLGADDPEGARANSFVGGGANQDCQGSLRNRQGSHGEWERDGAGAGAGDGGRQLDAVGLDGYNGALTGDRVGTLGVNCGLSSGRNGVIERRRQLDAVTYAVDQGGGKSGANVYNDMEPTLCTTHGGEPAVAYTLKVRSGCAVDSAGKAAGKGALIQTDKAATLSTVQDQYLFQPVTDTHILDDQGGSVINVRTDGIGDAAPTLVGDHNNRVTDHTAIVVEDRPGVAYGIDRAAYNQGQNAKYDFSVLEEQQPTMVARGPGAVTYYSSKASFFTRGEEELASTLVATDYKDPPPINDTHNGHYIVRRLTPTECARLQGFPDRWGDIKPFDPTEWEFWAEVRNTHAAINGRKVQEYTAKQMETWYNKLHTDSAEYKMWGNGIAIPPALYCMQGMTDALNNAETGEEAWML